MRSQNRHDTPPEADAPTVLVLGATGRVGAVVTEELLAMGGPRVVVGSRTISPGRTPEGAMAVSLDIRDHVALRRVLTETRCDVVVLCVEPADTGAHRACLEAGASVVDVCATADQLARVEGLSRLAETSKATVLLSIGLAPGLTNHLAAQVAADLGGADRLDLTVLLGAGESHGADAVRWTLDGLTQDPRLQPAAARTIVPGFGRRRTYPMPFSDQSTLRRTLGVPAVATRMCLDSRAASTILFSLAATRAGRHMLRSVAARRVLTASSGSLPIGSEKFLVMAEGQREGRIRRRWISGSGQSRTTGQVAFLATRVLLDGLADPGVWHLEQVPALTTSLSTLTNSGHRFGEQ